MIGLKESRKRHLSYSVVGPVAKLTATPASIAAQMLLKGEIKNTGIFPPEGCRDLDIIKFRNELEQRGIYFIEAHK